MSCILRVGGTDLDVEALIASCGLAVDSYWKKGNPTLPKTKPEGKKHESSGVRILVSAKDFSELSGQISDAVSYLRSNQHQVHGLVKYPGVEWAVLDFGVEIKPPWYYWYTFPPELLLLVGTAGIELCVSPYPCVDDEAENENEELSGRADG